MKRKINTPEELLREIDWAIICRKTILSEEFMNKYSELLDWESICAYQVLSEDFIEQHREQVRWGQVFCFQILSEPFLEKYMNPRSRTYMNEISINQHLSEEFIERHANEVDWTAICRHQKLSEPFMERHVDKLKWDIISFAQNLSEAFIEQHADKLAWNYICKHQSLSESFIERNIDRVIMNIIVDYQYLSPAFRKKHDIKKFERNLYKKTETKKAEIVNSGEFECFSDYFIAYKNVRRDNFDNSSFSRQYLVGQTYHSHTDFVKSDNMGFGLFAESLDKVDHRKKVLRVKIFYEDLAVLKNNNTKAFCTAFTVLSEV